MNGSKLSLTNGQLTDKQVANWRRILPGMFGVYARLMSREQIQYIRDQMQGIADKPEEPDEPNESEEPDEQLAPPEPLLIVAEVMAALKDQEREGER